MEANDSKIRLYQHDSWQGPELTIHIRDGGTTDISEDNSVHDSTSSFQLFAPTNVEVELCQHHKSDDNFPGNTKKWRGNDNIVSINKSALKEHGVHDNVSCIRWYLNDNLVK